MPVTDLYQSLQRGVIDAAEWIGPADDRNLGLQKIWKYYYLEGLHQQTDVGQFIMNEDYWNSLPPDLQEIIRVAVMATVAETLNSDIYDNSIALHRLEDDRSHRLRRDRGGERPLEPCKGVLDRDAAIGVRKRNPVHLGREGAEPRLVRHHLRGEREREQRPPVEGPFERDHRRPLRVGAGELDRVLDRLGAGVEERRLRRACEGRKSEQPLGERDVHLVGDHGEVGVEETRCLLLDGRHDSRVRVADVEAADAAGEVDERVAVDVGDGRAAAVRDHDRQVDAERIGDDPARWDLKAWEVKMRWTMATDPETPGIDTKLIFPLLLTSPSSWASSCPTGRRPSPPRRPSPRCPRSPDSAWRWWRSSGPTTAGPTCRS